MIKIGKKPRQLADRFDAIDTGLRPSRTEGRGETTGRPVRFRVRPSSSLPAPLRSGTGFVPSPEPSLRGAVRSSPVAPLVRSLRREASPLGRHLLRSGTAPFRHRFTSAPASFLAGAYAARSLHFAEPLLRRSLRSLLPRSFASADTGFVRAPARSSPEPSLRRSRLRLRM